MGRAAARRARLAALLLAAARATGPACSGGGGGACPQREDSLLQVKSLRIHGTADNSGGGAEAPRRAHEGAEKIEHSLQGCFRRAPGDDPDEEYRYTSLLIDPIPTAMVRRQDLRPRQRLHRRVAVPQRPPFLPAAAAEGAELAGLQPLLPHQGPRPERPDRRPQEPRAGVPVRRHPREQGGVTGRRHPRPCCCPAAAMSPTTTPTARSWSGNTWDPWRTTGCLMPSRS
ncbi:unnamed protein product [Prorocentrum cordatum]|uniref:Astrotactin-2 n=1 Tax=Prorocentrum cordatum TaxID=2364126 RepID=A0ABN9VUH2_9DINO|nr:unnamed protein product [Polarella glacialis]